MLAAAQLPTSNFLNYPVLLARHGYSLAGYQATLAEAARLVLAHPLPAGWQRTPTATELATALEDQLFHLACVHLAPPTLVLEQLLTYFAAGEPALIPEATVHLLQHLGPLRPLGFMHPHPSPLPTLLL